MFQIFGIAVIFSLKLWGSTQKTKKANRLNKEEIKKQLIDSIVNNDAIETEELNEKAEKVDKPEDAVDIIKKYGEFIRTKKKGIISIAYHQGKIFKRFREKEKFMELVSEFKTHKSMIIFKINIFKLIDKHPKLMKSSATLGFLKNYYKNINQICQENSYEFKQVKVICLRKLFKN